MKFVFYDHNEEEVDIITDVLKSYGVHYKVVTRKEPHLLGYFLIYNVEIDVELAFYDFLYKEIDGKLFDLTQMESTREGLEKIYKAEPATKDKSKAKTNIYKGVDIPEFMTKTLLGGLLCNDESQEELTFDQLPESFRAIIKHTVPMEVLRDPKTRFYKNADNAYSIKIVED